MLGFSLYPHHLKGKSDCSLTSFCDMIARTADLIGIDNLGLGSDLCQDHPDSVVEWMRAGRWTKNIDYGEGNPSDSGFPEMPDWFESNLDFPNIKNGLITHGFSEKDVAAIMGENWLSFFDNGFSPRA
jgi:microsomal dipeptidase-like Zn-dependent dipeptidase